MARCLTRTVIIIGMVCSVGIQLSGSESPNGELTQNVFRVEKLLSDVGDRGLGIPVFIFSIIFQANLKNSPLQICI